MKEKCLWDASFAADIVVGAKGASRLLTNDETAANAGISQNQM